MKDNGPVTGRERILKDGTLLVSKTDLKGIVTFANEDFVAISGFSEQELLGKPHNIVRHPDMPKEAFADLWATLKSGKSWAGAVKNRAKNGDHYWVWASATPLYEEGRLAGFMSIRSKLPEAEKGVAVVASEVKMLATQTAKATEEIAVQIANMQEATGGTVTAIDGIRSTIDTINQIASTIASAVEEQGAATQEIARNVQQAAGGTQEVSANIGGVMQAASDTGAASTQVLSAASELSRQSETLRSEVDCFLAEVRAA